ncbi:NAD(P)H-quinone oxidoreductase [Salinimonas sediminis]|uniref:NAD(P)H-quinone oxidoreductase n=1 Tax=Salinimonas sediminis TaxID=2303538 RepID=A0A346NL66_9ALTE|nr:NAD(P)H-quinone oxidoreductase [Salinimonas sediminis]AXR06273.1 NAD(P)H-quinone oxidoreductase [Salinimonas sediminis]
MQFINFNEGEGPQGLFLDNTAAPQLKPGKVIIQVHAFGINRADTLQRQGKYPPPPGESPILGLEAAGEVVAVADDVTQWRVGDKVFGLMPGGGYAQQASVDAGHLMPLPSGVSMEQAAGLAEVFLTAYQALFALCQVHRGERALIHAGASGVGLAALQLCRLTGVSTAVTASSATKLAHCEQLGASVLINYQEQDFAEVLKQAWPEGANAIVDFVGGDYLNRNLNVLATDGTIIYLAMLAGRYADKLDMGLMLAKRARVQGSTLRSRSDTYKSELINRFTTDFLGEFANKNLHVNIDTVLGVEQISQAHQRLEDNDTRGKIVVKW